MPDENVNKWKQHGQVYFWRYVENTRNYPGWHLTADKTFCDGFADLTDRMLNAPYNSQKSLTVALPTKEVLRVPNNHGGLAGWKAPKLLILKHQKDNVSKYYSLLEEIENTVILGLSRRNLEELKECVSEIPHGKGDYSIEIGDTVLWFWWLI